MEEPAEEAPQADPEPVANFPKADADPGPFKMVTGADGKPATAAADYVEPKKGDPVAVIKTNHGYIAVSFFPSKAPKHVENFLSLAKAGFYDGTKFHRVIPGFMIQGGDPNSKDDDRANDGQGGNVVDGKEKTVKAEFNDIKHTPGILSMARSNDPNSASSQFFIMAAPYPSLDGQYSAFGQVVSGMDVVEKIVQLPRDTADNPLAENPAVIQKIEVKSWPLQ
jgi:cyclophilin family peptidyl-prolyl cis-trans isomerase